MSTFENIVAGIVVNSWHAAWRASYQRMRHQLGVTANVEDIGIRTWEQLPDEEARMDALGCLFVAYWRNTTDQDIRNELDEKAEFGAASAELRNLVDVAATGAEWVGVNIRALAEVLEELDRLRLAARRFSDESEDRGAA